MCKGNTNSGSGQAQSQSGTGSQVNTALPQYSSAYNNLLSQVQNTASTPYQNYSGPIVAGFNPQQEAAFGTVSNAAGATGDAVAQPYYGQAQNDFGAATTPLWSGVQQFSPSSISQYESPYTSDVVNATENQFANTNAQQFNQAAGSAAEAGAFGGDRQAVLDAQIAGQQQTAEAPVIAGLENTGYTTAEGEFNTQQQSQLGANEANAWLNSQAGFGEENLGSTAQNAEFAGANQESAVGSEQQALAQENLNVPYEQFLAQEAYPFQTEGWASGLETGLGGAAGSTSSSAGSSTGSTQNQTSLLSQIFGGLTSGIGLAGESGLFDGSGGGDNSPIMAARGGGIGRDIGGPIPGMLNAGSPTASVPDVDVDIIPSDTGIFGAKGPAPANAQVPKISSASPQQSSGSSSSSMGGLVSLASAVLPFLAQGGGIANVIPFPHGRRARGGRGIAGYADGGGPANDDSSNIPFVTVTPNQQTGQYQGTGTDGASFDQMPFPHVDFHPQALPDNSAAEMKAAPWEALTQAGASMLQTGNIGSGIAAGLKSYQGARQNSQAQQAAAVKEANDTGYKQADVEKGVDQLWATTQDAQARLKQQGSEFNTTQAFDQQKFGEDVRHNKADETNTAHAQALEGAGTWTEEGVDPTTQRPMLLNNRTGQEKLGNSPIAAKPTDSGIPGIGMTPGGGQSGVTGDAYLKTLPATTAAQVKALADGRMQFPSGFALSKPYWQQMLSAVSQYDPSFDAVNYNSRAATRKWITSGPGALATTAMNTALGHAAGLQDNFDALGNTSIPALNAVKNWGTSELGGAAPTVVKENVDSLASEARKVYGATGGGNLTELENWQKNFPINGSPAQQKGALNEFVSLLDSKLSAVGDQYNRGMGKTEDPLTLLSPDGQKAYTKLTGRKPESGTIPGQGIGAQPQGAPKVILYDAKGNRVSQ